MYFLGIPLTFLHFYIFAAEAAGLNQEQLRLI